MLASFLTIPIKTSYF